MQAKDVDDQKMMTKFEDKGEKKVTREGRGRAGLVQGADETHRMNETCGKSKGKGTEEKENTEERETREAKAFSRA